MIVWVHVEGKVWLLMLHKTSSHGDGKVSGGLGAWEEAKLSHPVKTPKEETWDLRDLRNSPTAAQQTHSCLLCHAGKQALPWLLHVGDGSTAQKISAFPPKCYHQPLCTICSCPSALITLLSFWCRCSPAHHYKQEINPLHQG